MSVVIPCDLNRVCVGSLEPYAPCTVIDERKEEGFEALRQAMKASSHLPFPSAEHYYEIAHATSPAWALTLLKTRNALMANGSADQSLQLLPGSGTLDFWPGMIETRPSPLARAAVWTGLWLAGGGLLALLYWLISKRPF